MIRASLNLYEDHVVALREKDHLKFMNSNVYGTATQGFVADIMSSSCSLLLEVALELQVIESQNRFIWLFC